MDLDKLWNTLDSFYQDFIVPCDQFLTRGATTFIFTFTGKL